jgi:hypothetical protein
MEAPREDPPKPEDNEIPMECSCCGKRYIWNIKEELDDRCPTCRESSGGDE